MFSYLHDRMHIKDFWMGRAPLLSRWFLRARRLHDIHHHVLNNEGLMDKNFGIGFFVFDRLFGTLAYEGSAFNRPGHAVAQRKFRDLYSHKNATVPAGSVPAGNKITNWVRFGPQNYSQGEIS